MLCATMASMINVGVGQSPARAAVLRPVGYRNGDAVVGIVQAPRHACAVVADFLADAGGICSLGQREPERRHSHAKQNLAHFSPPDHPSGLFALRPIASLAMSPSLIMTATFLFRLSAFATFWFRPLGLCWLRRRKWNRKAAHP